MDIFVLYNINIFIFVYINKKYIWFKYYIVFRIIKIKLIKVKILENKKYIELYIINILVFN